MKTIGVLTSYNYSPVAPDDSANVKGLIKGLKTQGLIENEHYCLQISHSDDLEVHRKAVMGWLDKGIDLIFSGGTPGAGIVQEVFGQQGCRCPLIYYGAHPIDGDLEVALSHCCREDCVCIRIELPLTYTHRNFRLLRLLFPDLRAIHIPFARNTAFCHPEMADRYDKDLSQNGPHHWLEGDAVGFNAIRDLCWLIDVDYFEYPLRHTSDFAQALNLIPPRRAGDPVNNIFLAFNDTFHVLEAPHTLMTYSKRSNIPVVWVNNASMARNGAVADFCNEFHITASHGARFVALYLEGRMPAGKRQVEWNHDVTFTFNQGAFESMGIALPPADKIAQHFHRIIRTDS